MFTVAKIVSLAISIAAFGYTIYVMGALVLFLSTPGKVNIETSWILNILDNRSLIETTFPVLVSNFLLIILFIMQHSLMKSVLIKSILRKVGLSLAERAIFSLTSSICLWYLINNWKTAGAMVLWQIDVGNNTPFWWLFVSIHALAWLVIYGGCLIMDLPEIIGIKQVLYSIMDYEPPMSYKSFELRHLYTHVRHPSFVGVSSVLWFCPVMTLDRFILSVVLTLYMYIGWSTDHDDIIYHKCQLQKKKYELSTN